MSRQTRVTHARGPSDYPSQAAYWNSNQCKFELLEVLLILPTMKLNCATSARQSSSSLCSSSSRHSGAVHVQISCSNKKAQIAKREKGRVPCGMRRRGIDILQQMAPNAEGEREIKSPVSVLGAHAVGLGVGENRMSADVSARSVQLDAVQAS